MKSLHRSIEVAMSGVLATEGEREAILRSARDLQDKLDAFPFAGAFRVAFVRAAEQAEYEERAAAGHVPSRQSGGDFPCLT